MERWLVRLTSLLVLVLLGRILSPAEFGVVAAASVFVDFVALFVGTGLNTYLVQKPDMQPRDEGTAFWIGAVTGAILMLGVVAAAPLMPDFGGEDTTNMIRVLSIGMLFAGVASVPTAILQRRLAFRQLAVRSVSATVISAGVAVTFALNGAGAWSLIAQTVVFSAVRTVSVYLAARWTPQISFSLPVARDMSVFTAKMVGMSLVQFVRGRGESLMIAGFAGPTALGLWVIASRIVSIVVELVNGGVSRVAIPIFARAKSDPIRLARGYSAAVVLIGTVLAPTLLLLAAVSKQAVPLVFGSQWESAGNIAAWFSIGLLFLSTSYLDNGLLVALNRAGLSLWLTIIGGVTQLLMVALALALDATLVQLAMVVAVRNMLYWPIRLLTIRRVTDVQIAHLLSSLVRIWICSAFGALVSWVLINQIANLLSVWPAMITALFAGAVTYVLLLMIVDKAAWREVRAAGASLIRR